MLKGFSVVLISSDRAASGEREDATGPALQSLIEANGGICKEVTIVCDEAPPLRNKLIEWSNRGDIDVILTSGGTGIGPRDITVDISGEFIEKELPGFGEEMRRRSLEKTPFAILSRATAGTFGNKIILNLPGSPKGALECFEWVMKPLVHAVELLKAQVRDCQSQ